MTANDLGAQVQLPVDEVGEFYTDAASGTKHGPTVVRADYMLLASFVKLGATAKRISIFRISHAGVPVFEVPTKELADRYADTWAAIKRQTVSDDQYLIDGINVLPPVTASREITIENSVATTITAAILMGARA
jgi:hypothetical protein